MLEYTRKATCRSPTIALRREDASRLRQRGALQKAAGNTSTRSLLVAGTVRPLLLRARLVSPAFLHRLRECLEAWLELSRRGEAEPKYCLHSHHDSGFLRFRLPPLRPYLGRSSIASDAHVSSSMATNFSFLISSASTVTRSRLSPF